MEFKCKICGGNLNIVKGQRIVKCPYCDVQQTLPKGEIDRLNNLYERANHFFRNNEYDKAEAIYEAILNEDTTDAEAYWSLILCKYGVEYVKDSRTDNYIPTCNRTRNISILADEDYKKALENATEEQKEIYIKQAYEINEIQKKILEISSKTEPFDIFICYKEKDEKGERTQDSVIAQDIYYKLTQMGFKTFFSRITLENKLGTEYEPYIYGALTSAKVMILIGTNKEYMQSPWVRNEWSRFLSMMKENCEKVIIPCYKDMSPYDMPEELMHIQAQDISKIGAIQDLIRGVEKIICKKEETIKSQKKYKAIIGLSVLIFLIAILISVFVVVLQNFDSKSVENTVINDKTKTDKSAILREDLSAINGYTFNITVDELKEKLIHKIENSNYSEMIKINTVLRDSEYIQIGWYEGIDVDDDYDDLVGIEIFYEDSNRYVTSVKCIPTKYGSGDMTPLVVPSNLYEETKIILGCENEEWKKLVSMGRIKERVYNRENYEEVKDGSFYAGMEKNLYIDR